MAREGLLVGVSEEELRPNPKPEPPKTPKGKLENFWYHYKWHTIITVFVVGVLAVLIGQLVTKDDPDYSVVLAIQGYASDAATAKLEAELEKYGVDVDGDGKVEVQINSINLGDSTDYGMANQIKLMAQLATGDMMFYIFDQETYEKTILPQMSEETTFFASLGIEADGLVGKGNYWNWKGDTLRSDQDLATLPENLYFGVRQATGTAGNEKSQKLYEQCSALLRAFLTKTPQETATAGS